MKIEKLPKWAQKHIADVERERDTAVRQLKEYVDDQTEAPFFYDDLVCIKDGKSNNQTMKKYIQTRRMTVKHGGVELTVSIRDTNIELSWGGYKWAMNEIAFIPRSFQQASLVSRGNMRE